MRFDLLTMKQLLDTSASTMTPVECLMLKSTPAAIWQATGGLLQRFPANLAVGGSGWLRNNHRRSFCYLWRDLSTRQSILVSPLTGLFPHQLAHKDG